MQITYTGNIEVIRAVEDCIRATKKYTEGIGTMRRQHPIQGEEFPSKTFVKYYEVYPDTEISWNMPANVAIDWLWADTPRIDMMFYYNYRSNEARVVIKNGNGAIQKLIDNIPNLKTVLEKTEERYGKHLEKVVGRPPSHIHVKRVAR